MRFVPLAFLSLLIAAISGLTANAQSETKKFRFTSAEDRLLIQLGEQPVADFVFQDPKILRPYFSNVRTAGGIQVTRRHPPVPGSDAVDHDTMHPGIWLAFGDISGRDYWRNKATMKFVRFVRPPQVGTDGSLAFSLETECLTEDSRPACRVTHVMDLRPTAAGWSLVWRSQWQAIEQPIVFGDQEEMGFGIRVATAITEKNGGLIRNSAGLSTAKATWGQLAAWCDYSGSIDGVPVGITTMADPANFREPRWHNRDYGLMVANPFAQAAMKQGERSSITVQPAGDTDKSFRLGFAALIHEGPIDLATQPGVEAVFRSVR